MAKASGTTLALAAIVSVQIGAAVAEPLLATIGPPAVVLMRQGFAALILLTIARPRVRGRSRQDLLLVGAFGATLGLMNLCFYQALQRLPLGPAVTIELLGPLGLAAVQSRTARHILAVVLAVVGVLLLGGSATGLNPVGLAFVSLAAVGWGVYIVLSRRVGLRFESLEGLALAMVVAAMVALPFAAATTRPSTWSLGIVGRGVMVALLAATISFSLELSALRSISTRQFGIVMGTSPAVATIIGWLALGEHLTVLDSVAVACVTAAAVVASIEGRPASQSEVDQLDPDEMNAFTPA